MMKHHIINLTKRPIGDDDSRLIDQIASAFIDICNELMLRGASDSTILNALLSVYLSSVRGFQKESETIPLLYRLARLMESNELYSIGEGDIQ